MRMGWKTSDFDVSAGAVRGYEEATITKQRKGAAVQQKASLLPLGAGHELGIKYTLSHCVVREQMIIFR